MRVRDDGERLCGRFGFGLGPNRRRRRPSGFGSRRSRVFGYRYVPVGVEDDRSIHIEVEAQCRADVGEAIAGRDGASGIWRRRAEDHRPSLTGVLVQPPVEAGSVLTHDDEGKDVSGVRMLSQGQCGGDELRSADDVGTAVSQRVCKGLGPEHAHFGRSDCIHIHLCGATSAHTRTRVAG